MMKKLIIILGVVAVATVGLCAWMSTLTKSNGTTAVTIVPAPGASTTRIVAANGGVTVFNSASTSVTFSIQVNSNSTLYTQEVVTVTATNTYINDWSLALDHTDKSLEIEGATAFGEALQITTRYSDQGQ